MESDEPTIQGDWLTSLFPDFSSPTWNTEYEVNSGWSQDPVVPFLQCPGCKLISAPLFPFSRKGGCPECAQLCDGCLQSYSCPYCGIQTQVGSAAPPTLPNRSATPVLSRQASNSSLQSMASATSTSSKRSLRIPGGYFCPDCGSAFDRPGDLRHHQRKHQPEKDRPYACTICEKRFTYPKDVKRHHFHLHPEQEFPPAETGSRKRRRSKSPVLGEKAEVEDLDLPKVVRPMNRMTHIMIVRRFQRVIESARADVGGNEHQTAAIIAKELLSLIGSLIKLGHKYDDQRTHETTKAIDHLTTELDLVGLGPEPGDVQGTHSGRIQ